MNIVYASDERYAMVLGTAMESLYQHHREVSNVDVYILANQITEKSRSMLEKTGKNYGRNIQFVDVDESQFQSAGTQLDGQRWGLAAFARLITPTLLPELDRILYLDCDTLVQRSLAPLWETELSEYSCAAVAEPFSPGHKRNVRLKKKDVYFNSGVMLIDLKKWREMNVRVQFIECISRHRGHVPYVDQGVLNEVLNKEIKLLPAKYNVFTEYYDFSYEEVKRYRRDVNVYSEDEIENAKKEPCIIHFTSSFLTPRPWVVGSTHPYAGEWLACRDATPWKGEKLWPNSDGFSKKMLKRIFETAPRGMALRLAEVVNSIVRPMVDK